MRKFIFLLWVMPLLFASCSNDEEVVSEEIVQVSFSAELPERISTRAEGIPNVDKVVCAVFEDGTEIGLLRQVIDITGSDEIQFTPRLIKGHTYNVVFWAMKEGRYNVDNMEAITRVSEAATSELEFEAFTKSVEVNVTGSTSQAVTLKRPYAQLNLGVSGDDWNTVVNTFGMTPAKMVITMTGTDTFDALAGTATGSDDEQITRNLEVSGNDLSAGENIYKSIASCYVYPDAGQQTADITYTISTAENRVIRNNAVIQNVPLQANYRTNVVGGLLTGTITYMVTFDDFTSDNNNVIQN